ncbi:MAG TPA: aminotransferase class I/II-fold pyridoxal phosphate-dependent enzyme [Thermoanaerobaculia bacterium]|nr:aminotransferase class I/II-fold pyridoxal phosphate-dependent enzyme [Thermoanaerobaculia bacterium]
MDVARYFDSPEKGDAGLSVLARGVVGSEILRISAEIRAMHAKGLPVCNLTVGDFDPKYFPIPKELLDGTRKALEAGQTNYPPAEGILPLREAVVRLYERELGLSYPVDSVVIASGARPLLYGAYRTLVDPGDTAIYPVPTWNNNHYAYLSGALGIPVIVSAASNFFPTPDQLRPHLSSARLLILNSPLNPTGTVISREALTAITTMVVEENRRREAAGTKPLYFVYDQVYWTLTFGKAKHHTPVGLVPESARYVIFLDAISKAFCATGLRVGWGVMPPAVRRRMSDILGHVGAWAPKAEQLGVAALLNEPEAISAYSNTVRGKLVQRLEALYRGVMEMKSEGFPVDAIEPQGAIYLSARFDLFGRKVNGTAVKTNDDVRRLLLGAGIGVVPFQAFGLAGDTGWFRLSAGAVSMEDIASAFPRLRALLAGAPASAPL